MEITYKQFTDWCVYWGYTEEEGFKAICAASQLLGFHLSNAKDKEMETHSELYKRHLQNVIENRAICYIVFNDMSDGIFNMLDKKNPENTY